MSKNSGNTRKPTAAVRSGLMAHLHAAEISRFGPGGAFAASGDPCLPIGIPLPSLALEVLLGTTALQLGRIFGIAGPPQSFKSMLALELSRIVAAHGGIVPLVETEGGKISPGIVDSIYGKFADHLDIRCVTSVERAQEALSFAVDWLKDRCPDRNVLLALVLDSLNGCASDVRHKSIAEKGHACRDYPIEALLWNRFISDIVDQISGSPIILVLTNHLKKAITNDAASRLHLPGGDAQLLYTAAYVQLQRGKQVEGPTRIVTRLVATRIKPVPAGGLPVLEVPVVVDLEDGGRIFFDWPSAVAHLLSQPLVYPGLRDVVDVSATGRSIVSPRRRFTSKRLGLVAASASELAAAVQGDQVLMDELRSVLGVVKLAEWSGSLPQGDAICDLPERAAASDDNAPDSPWAQLFGEW